MKVSTPAKITISRIQEHNTSYIIELLIEINGERRSNSTRIEMTLENFAAAITGLGSQDAEVVRWE